MGLFKPTWGKNSLTVLFLFLLFILPHFVQSEGGPFALYPGILGSLINPPNVIVGNMLILIFWRFPGISDIAVEAGVIISAIIEMYLISCIFVLIVNKLKKQQENRKC